jgi:uncharacterized protein YbaP (TraB family)
MIWKFDNSNTYLLGSIHVLKAGPHPYSKQIDDIYSRSSNIIFETDLDNIPPSLFTYNDGTKLSDTISESLYRKILKYWIILGLNAYNLEKNKLWAIALILSLKLFEQLGFSSAYGIDRQLLTRAKSDNKNTIFLEPANVVSLCFDAISLKEQEEYLLSFIEDTDIALNIFDSLMQAWLTSDIDLLTSILEQYLKKFHSLFQCLVIKRNEAWIDAIITKVRSGEPTLIVVGALHCVDFCSVQQLIRNSHGYTSTALK